MAGNNPETDDTGNGPPPREPHYSPLAGLVRFSLKNRLVVFLFLLAVIVWGIAVAPFDWNTGLIPRSPVPVDAIPDIGENQQIVFTEWMGRSPRDIEDQITYPLTVSLLGMPGVKTIRSYSYFGFSTVYVIFRDGVDFYWSRSRLLEKLNSLPPGTLPSDVQPILGPDATALGQVFWYTLEGRDKNGEPTGGWDLHELRSIQDYTVKYALMGVEGIAEVSSVGGFVREYQVDIDPAAMLAHGVGIGDIYNAVRMSNIDVGARTAEINSVEYVIRGVGFLKGVADIENTVIKERDNVPVRISDVARVSLGPAARRGALDKGGAEAVGGVVVVRYGGNPLAAIKRVKEKIDIIAPGLPSKTLSDGTVSRVTIVPFYDRTKLIYETLGTLNTALVDEILVTIIVILVMVMNLRAALLISGLLPVTILMVFVGMRAFGVDANIVALSGIAIAIGTIVDMGIVITENILKALKDMPPGSGVMKAVYRGAAEVSGAVTTAIATTVVSFLPVFTMTAAEGKLFKPLAYTKTFALVASVIVALIVIPPFAYMLYSRKDGRKGLRAAIFPALAGAAALIFSLKLVAGALFLYALFVLFRDRLRALFERRKVAGAVYYAIIFAVAAILSAHWRPLGLGRSLFANVLFSVILLGGILLVFNIFSRSYERVLRWALSHRRIFLSIPIVIVLFGFMTWRGFGGFAGLMPEKIKSTGLFVGMSHAFPGMGKEFMPSLDEGSFLYMPTIMPHGSIGEALDVVAAQDKAFSAIPEVESVVGKVGRADSPLDPAPVSMIETVINYKPEYVTDKSGKPMRFKYDKKKNEFVRSENGNLIEDRHGRPYRNWRGHIKSPRDIWDEIVKEGKVPGSTSAPMLQPIETRIIMLQSGMRAAMGVKVRGPDLESVEKAALEIEGYLKEVPGIDPSTVFADRVVGKPYLEIVLDREKAARYGMHVRDIQNVIEVAVGGKTVTNTVEGRERYPVRVRYPRELRGNPGDIGKILVPSPGGAQVPLGELASIEYLRGPMVIKSEDTFLTGYVIFDKQPGYAEVDIVTKARRYLEDKTGSGEFQMPAETHFTFAGSYENQVRSERTLMMVLPAALFTIFMILYFQFKSVHKTALIFSTIFVAWSGGFLMLWLYSRGWFLDFSLFGIDFRELFHIRAYNLSVAVWVGFLALFGIASDDGVLISTYLDQLFEKKRPGTVQEIREATVLAGEKRIRPALMTSATTILALIPVLTSSGRGSDILVPMAIPSFGGMTVVMISVFMVPVLYSMAEERKLARQGAAGHNKKLPD